MTDYVEGSQNPPAWWVGTSPQTEARLDANYYQPRFLRDAAELESCHLPVRYLKDVVAKVNCGATPKNVSYGESGTALIRGAEIRPNYFDNSQLGLVPGLEIKETSNLCVLPGDVLYTMSGANVGMCATYPAYGPSATFSNTVARARTDTSLDPFYLCVFLNSRLGFSQTLRLISGAVQGHVMPNPFKRFRIPVPDSGIPIAIGNKLRKAERLRELAEAARLRFRQWLERASAYSKLEPRNREYLGHSPDATYPDGAWISNVDTADRIDPWPHHLATRVIRRHLKLVAKALPLDEFLSVVSSKRASVASESLDDSDFHIGVLDIDPSGGIDWNHAASTRYDGSGVAVESGDLIYSCLNPKEARSCVLPKIANRRMIASLEFSVLRPTSRYDAYPHVLAALLRSPWVRVQSSFLTRSSSLSRRRLQEDDLLKVLVPWCGDDVELLNSRMQIATGAGEEATHLVAEAKAAVESLIDGTLDEERLLAESTKIEKWLKKTPSPHEASSRRSRLEDGES